MVASSNSDESAPPNEEPIGNLNEGPWPGPIERPVVSGEVHFGQRSLPEPEILQIKKHRRGRLWYLTASAVFARDAVKKERWDYDAEVTITEGGEGLLRGVCLTGERLTNGSLELKFHDGSRELERKLLNVGFFGMTNKEKMFWIPQFAGLPEPYVPDFTPDKQLRPFIYAVPVTGLSLEGQKKHLYINDLGLVAGEADTTIYPMIEQLKFQDQIPLWKRETPKAYGVVMARSLLDAEQLALRRASLTVDLIDFTLRTGVSHWETRRESNLLEWNCETAGADVRLSDWILVREVQYAKGWVRVPVVEAADVPIDLDTVHDRLVTFLSQFQTVSTVGDVVSQAGRRQLSETEKKLADGIQRALHWYRIAIKERDMLDRFLAIWIALEATLECISYPGVFDGDRQTIRSYLDKNVENAPYPQGGDPLLCVSAEMMKNRLLAGEWPLPRKLELFAKSFGISLQSGDADLVRKLGRLRGQALHAGKRETSISEHLVSELKYLTERLIIAASVCAYGKLEEKEKHTLRILPIGPQGGAAPILLDGQPVAYEFYMRQDATGNQQAEWVIEGLIYDDSNTRIE